MPTSKSLLVLLALATLGSPSLQAEVQTVWTARHVTYSRTSDQPVAVKTDAKDNVIITGAACIRETGTSSAYTAKYAVGTGKLLWEQKYDGPGNHSAARALALDKGGNVIITGLSNGYRENSDLFTAKYSGADGTLLWLQRRNGPADGNDSGESVAVDSLGNVFVTGYVTVALSTDSVVATAPAFAKRYYTVKYASTTGEPLWHAYYNFGSDNGDEQAVSIAVDSQNDVIITGAAYGDSPNLHYVTIKYDGGSGSTLWVNDTAGNPANSETPVALVVDRRDDIVVTGDSRTVNETKILADTIAPASTAIYTVKYKGKNGDIFWEQHQGGDGDIYHAAALALDSGRNLDSDWNIFITGTVCGDTGKDYYTVKYAAPTGAFIWDRIYDGRVSGDDEATGIAIHNNHPVVTGFATCNKGIHYHTIGYDGGNGTTRYERAYNGPFRGNDYAAAITTDSLGNAIVTGQSAGPCDNYVATTLKYQP